MAGRGGFTLIELSVVTSIIGLVLLLSFPTLSSFKEQIYLESASKQLVSDLRTTQIKAVCLGEEQSFQADDKRFIFSRTGNPPPGGSGTEIISGKTGSRRVIVSSVGRVRIE